jgi:AcrR family transcriptional regulator
MVVGGEGAHSTPGLPARAGLSVGALYRFFEDKAAIVDALASRYLEAVAPAYTEVVSEIASLSDLEAVLGELLSRAAALQEQHPGYYRLTEELAPDRGDSPAHAVREHLVDLFADALRGTGVQQPPGDLRRVVELCIETVRHTLAQRPPGHEDREASLAEVELMLRSYLDARLR